MNPDGLLIICVILYVIFDIWNVFLYSSLIVLSIYNFDDDGYLIMYIILCYAILYLM
jgi:hypothetical protein